MIAMMTFSDITIERIRKGERERKLENIIRSQQAIRQMFGRHDIYQPKLTIGQSGS